MKNINYYIPEGCRIQFNYRFNYDFLHCNSHIAITDLERNLIVEEVQQKIKPIISSSIQLNSYKNFECDLIILTPDQLSKIIRSVEIYSHIKQEHLNEYSNSNEKISSLTLALLDNYNEK